MLIKPLQLGQRQFAHNLIQGPLAGVSAYPFRALTSLYGQPAFTCTEMISCKTILQPETHIARRYLQKSKLEGPVCFQLSANNADDLAQATRIATEHGADLIDLNCGCPVKKIRSKGAGSKLLDQPKQIYALITAMKKNTHLPVSIKIRIPDLNNEIASKELIAAINDAAPDFVIMHGRHWQDNYAITCRYEHIQYYVERLNIPVIGNGDIGDTRTLTAMLETGCAGAMIARAGVGQPWLIKKLLAEMQGETFNMPTLADVGGFFLTHVAELIDLLQEEKFAILQARQLAKYYARTLPTKTAFCEAVHRAVSWPQFSELIQQHFMTADSHPIIQL